MDDTVGATGRGGVAGNRPIGMRYEPGAVGGIPTGMRCERGVAGNRPIGMRYEPGAVGGIPTGMRDELGVVGKHPIGMPGVARCKHGVCARLRVGAKASAVDFSQANLDSQLPLGF